MGTKTVTAMQSDIRLRLGLSASDNKMTDADLITYINSALQQANNMRNWWWNEDSRTFNTVAGTSDYAFDSTHRKTLYLAYGDKQIPFRTKLDLIKFEDYEGEPRFWTVEDNQIRLFPTPDAVYTIKEVFQAVETVTAGGDTTEWPDYAIDLVILMAATAAAAKVRPEMIQVIAPELARVHTALEDETVPAAEGALPRRRNDWRP